MVSFYVNGIVQYVILDDYLPTLYDKPVFVHSKQDGELWPCLLEKAWAKLHGTYARVESGQPSDAATHILGVPSKSYDHTREKDKIWQKIHEAFQRKFLIITTSDTTENREMHGIIQNHGYQLNNLYSVKNPDECLVQLRNPWGSNSYSGDWCNTSNKWTPALKKQVNFEQTAEDAGLCYMPFSLFLSLFHYTSLIVEADMHKYNHSAVVITDFNKTKSAFVFYKFNLEKA